jgi:hypothetical protein
VDQPNADELPERFKSEYEAMEKISPKVFVSMSYSEAWALMQMIQLACKCPGNSGPGRWLAEKIARAVQRVICPSSALWEVAEDGWKTNWNIPSLHLEKNLN